MPAKKKAKKKTNAKKKVAAKKKSVAKKKTVKKAAGKKKAVKKKIVKKKAVKKKIVKKKTAKKTASKAKKITAKKKKKTVSKKKPALAKKTKSIKKTSQPKTAVKTRTGVPEPKPRKAYQKKAGEEYMNPAQVEHFRKILNDWKRDLLNEVDRTVHHMQDEASNFPDPNDRATQEEEFALELRTRDRERKLIKKINEALLSLDTGEYGYCEVCGVEIGVKRLEARPTATLCIDCKTLDEIKEKQLG